VTNEIVRGLAGDTAVVDQPVRGPHCVGLDAER
jgi:hypothetical protein